MVESGDVKATIEYTPRIIAKLLGVTSDQAKAGMLRNASAIRNYSDRDLKVWGKTREQANAIADDYERRSKL